MSNSQFNRRQFPFSLQEAGRKLDAFTGPESDIKYIRQTLEESEQLLSITFHNSAQAIGITSMKDARFIDVNESLEKFSGYSREEIIGRTATELNLWPNPKDRDNIFRKLQDEGRVANAIITLRDKKGQDHYSLFSAEFLTYQNTPCVISSVVDFTELENAESALRESQDIFSKIFNSSPTPICIFGVENQKIFDANDSFLKFTGYTRDEVIGRTPGELNLWVSQQEMSDMAAALQTNGGMDNMRVRSRMKTGEIRTGLFSARIFKINERLHLVFSIADVTDQAKALDAIANEAVLRTVLIEHSRDGIVILDIDGKVFDANKRYCEMLGYTPEEMQQLHVWDWDTQWDRNNLIGQIERIDEKGDHFETTQKRKDGTVIDVEISSNGAIIAGQKLVFCVCRDITKRKQMEKALIDSEETFSKVFHSSPEIFAITTCEDGTYIDVNENYCRQMGYAREELVGHTARSLHIWVDMSEREDMFKTLDEQGRISKKEYRFRTKSGDIRTWLFSAEKVTLNDEACVLGIAIDITTQKLMEQQAMEAENLREVDRLRRELLANVSHELRTPLAGIKGFATMLIDYGKRLKPAEKQEYLQIIDKNADRLVGLIEELIEMSRLDAGMLMIYKRPTDVLSLCRQVINQAREKAKDHAFKLDLPKKLPLIEIDSARIKEVLEHIIENSIKYSSAGTEISLSVRKNARELLFLIADHGIGISKEDMPHVFERLFAARQKPKTAGAGAGLGLSICKGLIEAHNGRIWFESEEGAGSRCFFTLPLGTVVKPPAKQETVTEKTGLTD